MVAAVRPMRNTGGRRRGDSGAAGDGGRHVTAGAQGGLRARRPSGAWGRAVDVRDVGVALWRQRVLVALVLLLTGLGVAAGLALAPKTYAATATLSAPRDAGNGAEDPQVLRATLADLANAPAVLEAARERVGTDRGLTDLRSAVDARAVRGTVLVEVTAEAGDPDAAASLADAVAQSLTDPEVLEAAGGAAPAAGLDPTVGDPATPPATFTTPDLPLAVGLGALLALGLATAAAVVRDFRTHTVDDAAAAEEAATAPLLAHLAPPADLTAMPALKPGTVEADLFRHLRLALEGQAGSGSPRVVVAGVAAGDVNVWIGANVALSLAGAGRRVLLVDGRMGERFGTSSEAPPDTPGLYDVLLGADLEAALSPGPVDLLQVLPAGTWGEADVVDLLEQRFAVVMEAAATGFDHVVVIGPPLEECEDSRVMAADATIVLALVERTVSTGALRAHADLVRAAGARLLGVVLVGRDADRSAA